MLFWTFVFEHLVKRSGIRETLSPTRPPLRTTQNWGGGGRVGGGQHGPLYHTHTLRNMGSISLWYYRCRRRAGCRFECERETREKGKGSFFCFSLFSLPSPSPPLSHTPSIYPDLSLKARSSSSPFWAQDLLQSIVYIPSTTLDTACIDCTCLHRRHSNTSNPPLSPLDLLPSRLAQIRNCHLSQLTRRFRQPAYTTSFIPLSA